MTTQLMISCIAAMALGCSASHGVDLRSHAADADADAATATATLSVLEATAYLGTFTSACSQPYTQLDVTLTVIASGPLTLDSADLASFGFDTEVDAAVRPTLPLDLVPDEPAVLRFSAPSVRMVAQCNDRLPAESEHAATFVINGLEVPVPIVETTETCGENSC